MHVPAAVLFDHLIKMFFFLKLCFFATLFVSISGPPTLKEYNQEEEEEDYFSEQPIDSYFCGSEETKVCKIDNFYFIWL